jgi:hypothetical protein
LTTARKDLYTLLEKGFPNRNTSRDLNGGYAESIATISNDNRNKMKEDNSSNNGLDDLYQEYWLIHSQKLSIYDPLEVAAVLMAQAMTIYKTVLDDTDYNKIVDDISIMRDRVKILTPEQGHYH